MKKTQMKKILHKVLPYIVLIVVVVFAVKIIDHFTDTDTAELDAEKKELLEDVETWKGKFIEAERERIKVREENKILKKEVESYETENDTVITAIRVANENRDFARLDSLGADLEDRLRRRRQP